MRQNQIVKFVKKVTNMTFVKNFMNIVLFVPKHRNAIYICIGQQFVSILLKNITQSSLKKRKSIDYERFSQKYIINNK